MRSAVFWLLFPIILKKTMKNGEFGWKFKIYNNYDPPHKSLKPKSLATKIMILIKCNKTMLEVSTISEDQIP